MVVATSLRLRGRDGRLTARLIPGGVDQIAGHSWVLIGRSGGNTTRFGIEQHSIYGGKLVLKLSGIDSAGQASELIGRDILIPCNSLVALPEGNYYIFELVGMEVSTREGCILGRVEDVIDTGGTPLLQVVRSGSDRQDDRRNAILIPAARSICTDIDTVAGTITIDPPDGLLELYEI